MHLNGANLHAKIVPGIGFAGRPALVIGIEDTLLVLVHGFIELADALLQLFELHQRQRLLPVGLRVDLFLDGAQPGLNDLLRCRRKSRSARSLDFGLKKSLVSAE